MAAQTRSDLPRQIRDTLLHLNDPAYLQTHPLARAAPAGSARSSGSALRTALLEAIDALRPNARTSTQAPAWRRYNVLVLRYAEGLSIPSVQVRLGIGKSEYHRVHQRALAAVASVLGERWALAHRPASDHPDDLGGWGRSTPKGLPNPLTELIGRESELAELMRLLSSRRLVTLTGPPGTGKSRLALGIARKITGHFSDGIHFLPLASISQASLVMPTIAEAFRVHEAEGSSVESRLASALERANALLVLDNFEQVVDAAPALAELLQACPRLKALVTSRVRLRVRGECTMAVSPLSLPSNQGPLLAAEISGSPAVQLFVERAREVNPGFELIDANAPTVAAICTRLEGLPLSLELAAANLDVLPLEALLARLDERLAVLADGPRDLPARHQTLQGAIDSSYQLLDSHQRTLFRHLGVFVGGWTMDAAEAVATGGQAVVSVLAGLQSLARASLVQRQSTDNDRKPRFAMLETIREYAVGRLIESGEAENVRALHAGFYLRLAEQAPPSAVVGVSVWLEEVDWLRQAEQEQENFRAAHEWAIQRGEGKQAVQLAQALASLWIFRGGHYVEGQTRLAQALALLPEHDPSPARTVALEWLGELAVRAGDNTIGRNVLESVVDAYQALGDRRATAFALRSLKRAFRREGDFDQARALDERALALFREIGDVGGTAQALAGLGHHYCLVGEPTTARPLLEEAINLDSPPRALSVLGNVACDEGKFDEARSCLAKCLAINRRLGDPDGLAEALEAFAGLAAAEAKPARAASLLAAASAVRTNTQTPLPPGWRPDLERRLQPAKMALSPVEWDAAWEAGLQMSADEAMDYALGTG